MVFPIVGGTQSTGYDISNSCQFNTDAYCEFTPSSGSGSTQFTYSAWVKNCGAGDLSETGMILSGAGAGSGADNGIQISSGGSAGKIQFIEYDGGDNAYYIRTNRLFRDPAAWFHLVLIYDAPDGTAGDRMRLYINGTRETSFSHEIQLPQNRAHAGFTRNNVAIRIGSQASGSNQRFDGYLADVYFCDGQNYEPSEFGETDDNGIWIPKKADVSFGTNGFKLEFKQTGTSANSSGIGADTSGNDNHFSVSGLDSTNITVDTPTNNFATFNPLIVGLTASGNATQPTFSEGNCKTVTADSGKAGGSSTIQMSSGKWYAEFEYDATNKSDPSSGVCSVIGVTDSPYLNARSFGKVGERANDVAFTDKGTKMINDSLTSYGNAYSTGNIIGVAVDLDNNKIYFSINGTWQNSGDPTSGATGTGAIALTAPASTVEGGYYFAVGDSHTETTTHLANFGAAYPAAISSGNADANGYGNFEYAVPSGYYALCTKNLAKYG